MSDQTPITSIPGGLGGLSVTFCPVVDSARRVIHDRLSVICPPSSPSAPVADVLKVIDQYLPRSKRPYLLGIFGARFDRSLLEWAAPEGVILEISGPSLIDPEMQEVVAGLRQRGVKLALRSRTHGHLPREFFANFEFAIIQDTDDGRKNRAKADPAECAPKFKRLPFMIAGAATADDETKAFARDAVGSIGWVERPLLESNFLALKPSLPIVDAALRLAKQEGDTEDIMGLIRLDPVLLIQFLTFVRSLINPVTKPALSLSHTISIAGFIRLERWLRAMRDEAIKPTHEHPLYYRAIRRGFIMQQLCSGGIEKHEKAYLIGLMSMVDRIGGITHEDLQAILSPMGAFGENVLSDIGKFTVPLDISTMIETNDLAGVPRLAKGLGIAMSDLNRSIFEALALANNATDRTTL